MEYKLLTSSLPRELSKLINKHLQSGWRLHGDTLATNHESWSHFHKLSETVIFSQAVVRGE